MPPRKCLKTDTLRCMCFFKLVNSTDYQDLQKIGSVIESFCCEELVQVVKNDRSRSKQHRQKPVY